MHGAEAESLHFKLHTASSANPMLPVPSGHGEALPALTYLHLKLHKAVSDERQLPA